MNHSRLVDVIKAGQVHTSRLRFRGKQGIPITSLPVLYPARRNLPIFTNDGNPQHQNKINTSRLGSNKTQRTIAHRDRRCTDSSDNISRLYHLPLLFNPDRHRSRAGGNSGTEVSLIRRQFAARGIHSRRLRPITTRDTWK